MEQNQLHKTTLVDAMNKVNIFGGKLKPQDLTCRGSEAKETEKKFRAELKKRERELKIQNEKRVQEEIEYSLYLKHQKNPQKNHYTRNTPHQECDRSYIPEKESLDFYEKEKKVKNNLQQYSHSNLHCNAAQKSIWTNDGQPSNVDQSDLDESDGFSRLQPSNTDQCDDDAETSTRTSYSWKSSSDSSFVTAVSPTLELPSSETGHDDPLQQPSLYDDGDDPLQQPSSYDDGDDPLELPSSNNAWVDPLAVLGSSRAPLARKLKPGRSTRSSLDILRPSRRILSNNIPRDFIANNFNPSGSNFILDVNDFPPL